MSEPWIDGAIKVLGGGLLAGIVTSYANNKANAKARREEREAQDLRKSRDEEVARLKEQLQRVYGPVRFYVKLNKSCFDHIGMLLRICNDTAEDDLTEADITALVEVMRNYIGKVSDSTYAVLDVLRDNHSYIDPEDIETLDNFAFAQLRHITETNGAGRSALTPGVLDRLTLPPVAPNEYINLVERKFREKQARLRELG